MGDMDTLFEVGVGPMGWVKVSDDFPTHPKAMRAGPHGRALYLYGLMWCGMHATNGQIPVEAMPFLAMCLGVPLEQTGDITDKLVEVRLWERTPDGWAIHDWLEWQTHRDEVKRAEQNRKAQQAYRDRASSKQGSLLPTNYSDGQGNYSALSLTCDDVSHLEPEPELEPSNTPPYPPQWEAEFNLCWADYPRKTNRKAALRAYVATRRRKVDPDTLLAASEGFVRAMKAEGREWRVIMHGSTFFGPDERWQDYLPGGAGLTGVVRPTATVTDNEGRTFTVAAD